MGDLISRRKLDGMRLAVPDFVNPDARTKGWNECITYVQQNAPAVDAEPVRRGEWQYSTKYKETSFGLLDDENCEDYICKIEARCPFCEKGWSVVGVFSSETRKEEAKKEIMKQAIRKAEDFRYCCGCGANLRGGEKCMYDGEIRLGKPIGRDE